MMFPRRAQPLWQYRFSGSSALARLGLLEGLARATLSVVVPLVALDVFGSRRVMSLAYAAAAAFALVVTLSIGALERRIPRRWIATAALMSMLGACLLVSTSSRVLLTMALALVAAGTTTFSLTLSLYIMETHKTDDLRRAESSRMFLIGCAWTVGPAFGVWARTSVATTAPILFAAVALVAATAYFWVLRLGDNPSLSLPDAPAPHLLAAVRRFASQRYLRIAYAVTTVRSMFWVALFLYAPAYAIDAGASPLTAGLFLSGLAGLLLLSPAIGRLAGVVGTRRTLQWAYTLMATGLGALGMLGAPRLLGLMFWAIAAAGASVVDVLGNIPFMRTVRRRDRVQMTAVFSTWRDSSALLTPLTAFLLLSLGSMRLVYAALAVACAMTAAATTYLPRRL